MASPSPLHGVPPQVEGVDGQARVEVGGRDEPIDQAVGRLRRGPDGQAERPDQDHQRAHAGRERGEHAQPVRPPIPLRIRRAAEQVPLQAHHRHDRDHEGVLELDQQGHGGADGRQLGPAARQPVEGDQHGQRADRVDLAPDRRVEDGARVEKVDGGGDQPEPLPAPGPELAIQEAARVQEEHGRHAGVGQDAGELDQAGVMSTPRIRGCSARPMEPSNHST